MDSNNNDIDLRSIVLIGFAVMMAMVIFRNLAAAIFTLLLGLAILGIVHLISFLNKRRNDRAYANSLEGIIQYRMELCNEQIEKNYSEIKDIRIHIRDLEFRLKQDFEINSNTREETQRVIDGFKKELALRETKLGFYRTCKKKLSSLLYNQSLAKDLIRKKERLSELQEDNYEDVAQMEMMKFDVEHDKYYADTIGELSTKMIESNNLDAAEQLQLQLVEITKELREL